LHPGVEQILRAEHRQVNYLPVPINPRTGIPVSRVGTDAAYGYPAPATWGRQTTVGKTGVTDKGAETNLGGLFEDGSFQAALRASAAVALVVGLIFVLFLAWPVVQPLLVAAFLATALWPWVSRISTLSLGPRRWRIPRVMAAALIYLAAFTAAAVAIWGLLSALIPQVDRLLQAYPQYTQGILQYLEPLRGGDVAGSAARVAEGVASEAARAGGEQPPPAEQQPMPLNVGVLALALFGGLVNLILVLVFTFFLLLEGDRISQGALLALPRERRIRARTLGVAIRDNVSRWVLAQATYASISAVAIGTAMWLAQIPSPWMYSIFAAFLAVLPGIGPSAALVPAFLVALDLAPWQPIAVAAIAVTTYALDGTVLVPKVFGNILRLPMVVVLSSTMIGALLMGVWGALIAPQVAVAIQMVIRDLLGREVAQEEPPSPVPFRRQDSA
jgi:predicted PurR-regulated permease PerM